MSLFRRRIAAGLSCVLIATLAGITESRGQAWAAEPSVELEKTPPVPVQQRTMGDHTVVDEAARVLRGNQPPTAAPAPGGGTPTATSLGLSASWQVAEQTGEFRWSYPLRVPPAPGGLEPQLAIGYNSSTVDGRTSVSNNQPSWVGEGWDLPTGFVERTYLPCASDTGGTTPPATEDLCWRSDNATITFPGGGGRLLPDGDAKWRMESDDGSRIERKIGVPNGDRGDAADTGEAWIVTTPDGKQYHFGSRPEANSTWTVPVFGDDANEPCNRTNNFAESHCMQAWRWNLDKIVDTHGNLVIFDYDAETNSYGLNGKPAAVPYIRGGSLRSISYGMRGVEPAAATVEFTRADRCVPGSDCRESQKQNWPDVPWDTNCTGGTCAGNHAPTFWSTKRLERVTTNIRTATGYAPVDSWTLTHEFPAPHSANERAALWLRSIQHRGHVGGEITLPAVTFQGIPLHNRIHQDDGLSPLYRYRVRAVTYETGGYIEVVYRQPECSPTSKPVEAHNNQMLCFPVRWTPPGAPTRTDYFHKYVVEAVHQTDRYGSGRTQSTRYHYYDGAAWHYDTSEFTRDEDRTWNEYRGFARIRVVEGADGDDAGPATMSEKRYHRGMNGDTLPGGRTRELPHVDDGAGGVRPDHDWFNGFKYYEATHLGTSETIVTKTLRAPDWKGPTASRGGLKAYIVRPGNERVFTAIGSGWREARVNYSYDDRGLRLTTEDLGDAARADDDRCTTVTYKRNTSDWIINRPATTQTVARKCADPVTYPADVLSGSRTAYDGQGFDAPPRKGDATEHQVVKEWPVKDAPVYQSAGTVEYDEVGRVRNTVDPLKHRTTVAYEQANGGPVSTKTETNALGHATVTTLEPAWGLPKNVKDVNGRVTETAYDPLGRVTEVWLPNRTRSATVRGHVRYSYHISDTQPTAVRTDRLGPNGIPVQSVAIYDGLLRLRQTQSPAAGGGRLLVNTEYDTQGRAYITTKPFYVEGAVDNAFWQEMTYVPGVTVTTFDGAGRQISSVFKSNGGNPLTTTATYGGDRVEVTPPPGAPRTTTVYDARGQVTEFSKGGKTTRYGYTKAGELATVTDPAKKTWRYGYNLLGQRTRTEDVDAGVSTTTYDLLGRPDSTTDARGVKLFYEYDALGRRKTVRKDKTDGTLLAGWAYDTVRNAIGMMASATQYVDGAAYVTEVTGYSALYQPMGTNVAVPATPYTETLAGTYSTRYEYNLDGSLKAETFAAIGDGTGALPQERVNHTYDDSGRPLAMDGAQNYVTTTSYTRYGEPNRVSLGDAGKRAWLSSYHELGTRRLIRQIVDAEAPAPMQADTHYTYNPAGIITSIKTTAPDLDDELQCYRYDEQIRLTEAWTPPVSAACDNDPSANNLAGPVPYWHSFGYDDAGNRTTETRHASAGDTVRAYSYTPNTHRLESVRTTSPAGQTVQAFTYDAAGNTKTRPGQILDWTEQGRLQRVTEGSKVTSFVYDAAGTRIVRDDPDSKTLYLPNQELRLDEKTGLRTGTRYYVHNGQVVASRRGGELSWLATDHQGTPQIALKASDLRVDRRRFEPFGGARGQQPSFPVEKGFVGGTNDAHTGLVHLGAREYDTSIGRFISVDPIIAPGDPEQLNGYSYAHNSPISKSDPTGLIPRSCPDGECRHGAHGSSAGPASTFNGRRLPLSNRNPDMARGCADGYGSCYQSGGYNRPPANPVQPATRKALVPVHAQVRKGTLSGPAYIAHALVFGMTEEEHQVMEYCGMTDLPSLSQTCDGINAAGYATEGEYGEAGMSGLGLIPGVSWIKGGGRAAKNVSCGRSFDPNTLVRMANGKTKKLKDVRVGDRVLATDPKTGKTEARKVTAVHVNYDTDLTDLRIKDSTTGKTATLHTTDDHPFWVSSRKAWVDGGDLRTGDVLASLKRHAVVVSAGRPAGAKVMLDLTVEGIHTYYVLAGTTPVLVHNCGGGAPRSADGRFAKRNGEPGRDGAADEVTAWEHLEMDGAIVRRGETGVSVPGVGVRKFDGTVQIDGQWYGIETKGGSAKRSPSQRAFDNWLNTPGNTVATKDGRTLVGVFDVWIDR